VGLPAAQPLHRRRHRPSGDGARDSGPFRSERSRQSRDRFADEHAPRLEVGRLSCLDGP
jgi:hypothetical protein